MAELTAKGIEARDAVGLNWAGIEMQRPTLPRVSTLLKLVYAVQDHTNSDEEAVAVISDLLDSGRVRLCGTLGRERIRVAA